MLSLHLCFLPWAIGTMHPWSQGVSLVLSVLGFVLAVASRPSESTEERQAVARKAMWPRLLRFPIFWVGLALLVYIALQGLNPSWSYTRNAKSWWLVRMPDIAWLPTSIVAPFRGANVWRELIIYSAAWLMVCSVWVGFTRRRSCRILLGVLTVNAVGLGVLLTIQRITGDTRLPWPLTEWTSRSDLTASFVYSNHAAAYFALMTFPAIVLAIWNYDQGARALRKSTPASVLALAAFFLAGLVIFTFSRGGSIALGAALLAFAGWFLARGRRRSTATGNDRLTLALVVIFGLFAVYAGGRLDFSRVNSRFSELLTKQIDASSVSSRLKARDAGVALLKDHGWRGIGAGGFRHLFPEYVRHHPEIYQNGRLFWEYLHNDWLEIPIELGAVGTGLLLFGAGYWCLVLIRRRTFWHSAMVPLLLGCGGTLLHAWYDFPLQCPAILATWCVLLTIAVRSVELESARRGDANSS